MENKKTSRRDFFKTGGAAFGIYTLMASLPLPAEASTANTVKDVKENASEKKAFRGPSPFCDKSLQKKNIKCDVLVAGGGLAGISAAISAARHGSKVVLIQDRSRLGGNASSEIRMHPLGMHYHRSGFREGGIIEELFLENLVSNPQKEWEAWDLLLYDKVVSEPNIRLFLDTDLCGAKIAGDKIEKAYARCDTTRTFYEIDAEIFMDCTGDSRLAAEAGAKLMSGRDTPEKYGESLSGYDPEGTRQGSSIMFTSRDYGKPMPFTAPSWIRKIEPEMLKHRGINGKNLEYGYWWIELGGDMDAIADNEKLRFELLRVVLGIWDYIKNSGKFPEAENRALDGIGMVPGRRESFRIEGEYVMTEHDIRGGWRNFPDAVAVGGWSMDDHPKEGFDATNRAPCRQIGAADYYNIPLGCLISKDFKNLMMAGRNISCSHVAFTSTRVMATCAAMGQAAGTAASICAAQKISPTQIRVDAKKMKALQQILLLDNQSIVNVKNDDGKDLAKLAAFSASNSAFETSPQNLANGTAIEFRDERKNRWIADAGKNPVLELKWNAPRELSKIQITFDAGTRELTMSKNRNYVDRIHWGPQPETVKDFKITGISADGKEELLADVKNNWRRLYRLDFAKKKFTALRLDGFATNGSPHVRIAEIRVY